MIIGDEKIIKALYPLHVEFFDSNIRVTATTGKYTSSIIIEKNFDYKKEKNWMGLIKHKLHHDIEKEIFKNRYKEVKQEIGTNKFIMVDTCCPENHEILVCNPKRYPHILINRVR